jgi:hypothetical protein
MLEKLNGRVIRDQIGWLLVGLNVIKVLRLSALMNAKTTSTLRVRFWPLQRRLLPTPLLPSATVQLHGWRITIATLKPLFVASRASRSGGHTGASAARPYRSLPVDGRLVLSIGRPVQAVVSPTYQDKPHNADDEKRG